jgi:methyltransferase-like protein/2-polyprenyl-3-methyl-5-hydroxy-6-metoxy-1,4-benzoquinol methylase
VSEALLAAYEEIPYDSRPWYPSHPDCQAAVATLYGMRPPAVEHSRVLEIGCAGGGNLIPMAVSLPHAGFLGIDFSPRQIADGRAVIQALGLANIELKPLNIMELGPELGTFDYIICHGVYSWVPAAVQQKILAVCSEELAPQGVACVSYNTYPGWHLRGMIRDMVFRHVRRFSEARVRIQKAREFLDFLARAQTRPDNSYARVVADEAAFVRSQSDSYVFHETLEEVNQPIYFRDFCERAHDQGLQYLADAWLSGYANQSPPHLDEFLGPAEHDRVEREQYIDFLRNQTFRASLLCHSHCKLEKTPNADAVLHLLVAGGVKPDATQPSIYSADAETFRAPNGVTMSTNNPLLKTALMALADIWPRAVPFRDLAQTVLSRLATASGFPAPYSEGDVRALAKALLHCYVTHAIELHSFMPSFVSEVGDRPVASPLARHQAITSQAVTNLWHHPVPLDSFHRLVIRQLDGTRTRAQLTSELHDVDGERSSFSGEAVDRCLTGLAHAALLIG